MKIGVNASAFQKIQMRSHFSDLAFRHCDDDVGFLNRG